MMQAKPEHPVVLTIDAGGTSVRYRLERASKQLIGDTTFAALIDGFPPDIPREYTNVDMVVAGITKISRPGVLDAWESRLHNRFPGAKCVILPDFELAAAAALNVPDAVMLLAGTGSLACAYHQQKLIRIGGRGWEYGDEGSGAYLTTEVIRRCVRVLDGLLTSTPFLLSVIEHADVTDAGEFIEWARIQSDQCGRGFLVPRIAVASELNVTEASQLMCGAGGWLARLAHTANRRVNPAASSIHIRAVGGLWDAATCLTDGTIKALNNWYEDVSFSRFTGNNLDGGRIIAGRTY